MSNEQNHTESEQQALSQAAAKLAAPKASWSAIFIGMIVAIALQLLIGLLGISLGFSIFDPTSPMMGVSGWGFFTALFMIITQLISLFIGAYIAMRLVHSSVKETALIQGVGIWALSTILVAFLGLSSAGLLVNTMGSAAASLSSAAVEVVEPVEIALPEDLETLDLGKLDLAWRDIPKSVRKKLDQQGLNPDSFNKILQQLYRESFSLDQQQAIEERLMGGAKDILNAPEDAIDDIDDAIDDLFDKAGVLSKQDLRPFESTLQGALNLSDKEAAKISKKARKSLKRTEKKLKHALEEAREEAVDAMEEASAGLTGVAFTMFLAGLLGLFAAIKGGEFGEQ